MNLSGHLALACHKGAKACGNAQQLPHSLETREEAGPDPSPTRRETLRPSKLHLSLKQLTRPVGFLGHRKPKGTIAGRDLHKTLHAPTLQCFH